LQLGIPGVEPAGVLHGRGGGPHLAGQVSSTPMPFESAWLWSRRRFLATIGPLAGGLARPAFQASQGAGTLVLDNLTLVDGTGAAALAAARVVIAGGRIVHAG